MKPTKTTSSFTRKMMMASEPANGNSMPSVILGSSSVVGTSSATSSMSSLTLRDQQHHVEGAKERKERQMRRLAAEMDDQRSKFERDKAEALSHQKEAMNRAFRVQLAKLLKEKEELQRKCQTLQSKEPNGKITGNGLANAAAASSQAAAAEMLKLIHENSILRIDKKKQEEQLQLMRESEQHRFENMRSLLDDKARELITFQKQLRQQIARLREESRTKDRVISHLESELRVQTGRAQQFRDILEQSLLTATSRGSLSGQQHNHNERDELIARERKLQVLVDDLRETMRHQQDTFAHEKKELLRRLSETERQQGSLRQKNKQVLTRNVQLAVKSQELAETVKNLQQQPPAGGNMSTAAPDTTNLKRSLTRPNVNQLGSPSKNDKQRRMEYVQQIQKLRKEQRYYSMWELPPLLEVDTDGLGSDGNADSDGSLSPAATSGVTSCSSDSAWSEDTRRELEVLFSQLSREHSDLQRNYQLLHEKLRQLTCFSDADAANVNYATLQADYNAARARIRDLEEILQLKNNREREASDGANAGRPTVVPSLLEIQAKFVREKHIQQTQMAILVKRLEEAKDRHQSVQAELNEARDQNELLEFRILELEEIQERAPSQCSTDQRDRKDVCTDTDSDDVSVGDSGITSLASLMVECPSPVLPRSPCSSGSSLDSDYLGEKISSVKAELQLMVSSLNDPSQKTVLAQLQALLGVCQSRLAHKSPVASETSNWDWQLQESGIFEEDHHHSTDGSTQTDAVEFDGHNGDVSIRVTVPLPLCGRVTEDKEVQMSPAELEDKSVQTAMTDVQDFAVQTDLIVCHSAGAEEKSYRDQGVQFYEERPMFAEEDSQTDGQVMTLEEFRDVESYYVQQIEILQKEKASHRKKFQASRDETTKSVQQLELLGRQFQERERQFEEILQKNCRAFERELETARQLNNNELSTLKECLQLVWHEVKDYANVTDMPKTSVMEFTQALISSLHGICNELGQLRVRVVDLADMEQAFQTTLRQADGLVHHMEEKHLQRIRELEHIEHELRIQLNHPTGSHQSYDMDGSLEIKIQELEQEKDALSLQVGKCQELEDYCQRLHGRLEEYEQRERSLHQAVQDTERRFSTREQRYREEIQLMKTELDKCRENEATWRQRLEQRDSQLGLMRNELEAEQKTIASLELEVKELQSKLDKDDTSFRNEVTKLRSQLTTSLAQLNELESLNCQLREKIVEYQNTIYSLQRSLDEKSCQNGNLMAENNRLAQAQMEMMSMSMVAMAKPLTEELLEIESDEGCMSPEPVAATSETAATLDDFQEISLPTTPTVVDGCNNVFEEHFKVLESLESYLETQHLTGATAEDNDESGISTSPSIHENENFALLEAQLSQLRTEKHFLLNSVVNSQKKDEVIQILVDQLKYNAPRQYLIETAAHIRKIATNGDYDANQHRTHDKDIDRVCSMLEAPIDLTDVTTEGCSLISQQPSASPNCNYDVVIPHNKVVRRQTTVTVLPEEDPLLSPPSDLKITRKVGNDGLVIAWLPSPDSECVGYLICVNGQEAHRGRNAQRTKAVLSGLDLHSEMDICIYSLSVDGLVSSPTTTVYLPDERLAVGAHQGHAGDSESAEPTQAVVEVSSPREVVVQTFYTNSSVTVRSSRRVIAPAAHVSRLPHRPTCVP